MEDVSNKLSEEELILQKRREFAEKMAGGKGKPKTSPGEKSVLRQSPLRLILNANLDWRLAEILGKYFTSCHKIKLMIQFDGII